MRTLRTVLLSLALGAVTLTGCIITQAQVLAFFELENPFMIGPPPADPIKRELVDLNTISDYADHKDDIQGLTDLAIVGTFTTVIGSGGDLEVWMTADNTDLATASAVMSQGTMLWGPKSIGAAGSATETVTITWDDSAALFDPVGKDLLIQEVKGDGVFTVYIFSAGAPSQTFEVEDGAIILTLSAGP